MIFILTTTTTTNAFFVRFPLWRGWKSGKRVSNGSDEGILSSIQAIKWRITRFSMPFDQDSLWIGGRKYFDPGFLDLPAGFIPGTETWSVDFYSYKSGLSLRDKAQPRKLPRSLYLF